MKSIGILIYGTHESAKIISVLDNYISHNYRSLHDYEVCIDCMDLESMQKYGYFADELTFKYLLSLSPTIYNIFLDRPDLKTNKEQRIVLLNYLISVDAKLIVVAKKGTKIDTDESELIGKLHVIPLWID